MSSILSQYVGRLTYWYLYVLLWICYQYIDEKLPEEYEKCLVGLNAITKEAWTTAENTEDKREKIQALSLVKECYSMKLELLTNASVVEDDIRFVSNRTNEMLRPSSNSIEEHDYDEDKDQLKEEQQEREAQDVTTNCVF